VWRKLGNESVGLNLAGPAGGAVEAVWFSPTGDKLYARTAAGQMFETSDFSQWVSSKTPVAPSSDPTASKQFVDGRYYSLGQDLQASDDNGASYFSLTSYRGVSIIGPHLHALAVSPLDSRQIVVANDYGVWRSTDAGLSWSSLNEDMPNLPMRRLLPRGATGALRAEVEGIGVVELPPAAAAAHTNWIPAPAEAAVEDREAQLRAAAALGTELTAFATSPGTWYAGAKDGRLWTSVDQGSKWTAAPQSAGGRLAAIATGDSPHSALMVVEAPEGAPANFPRVLRTIDDGATWEDVSSTLAEGAVHGVAVDPAAGVAYVAGDRGVFRARVDMTSAASVTSWQMLPGLPEARAMDVRLDLVRDTLSVALDGYGLYAAPSPDKTPAVRVLTAADEPAQAAAPGVLLHFQGNGLSQVNSESGDLALISTAPTSAQVQVPFDAGGSTLALTVQSSQGESRMSLPMRDVAPAILVDGDGLPILVDVASGLTLDARNMAHPGERIQVFASGLGKVNPDWRAGVPAPEDPPAVIARVEARLSGAPVEVTRATLAPGYVGLYLVELQLPGLLNAGAGDFSLQVNGEDSNHVKILVALE
jgi:uncharacterized protein (TIGR03437 family)